jgi:hypothetical protein
MTDVTDQAEAVWRFVPRGLLRHALAHPDAPSSLCGRVNPWSPEEWRGGSPEEPEEQAKLARLPVCESCLTKVRTA